MIFRNSAFAWVLLGCQQYAVAAPTWPASTDELEDLMFLNSGYRSRGFANPVTPCSTSPGPGRVTSAEWIRTAFHDMANGNTFTKEGGLDGSLAFETARGENVGSAFVTTLSTFAPFLSSRSSLADIIAAGVYTATRSCGGPIVPVRGGRIDATSSGLSGQVPLPENAIGTFQNQFLRMGYSATEMIEFVACGHTFGGVHSSNFPDIVPAGTAQDGFAPLDTTPAAFDNKVATEYLAGTTKSPLVVGANSKKQSDFVVFNSDRNATIQTFASAQTMTSRCRIMFQKMIDVVPPTVTLTDVIVPYDVKPYEVQLTLLSGGTKIRFTGDIRVRTTQGTGISAGSVQLSYKDRTGATVATPIEATSKGTGAGFDDTFTFFSFSADLPADTSISSFNVVVSGVTYDNNGNGFKVDDTVIYQGPQSCLDGSGKLTVVAAVRTGGSTPNLNVVVKNPRASPVVVPALSTATVAMASQSSIGTYRLYSGSYTLSDSQAQSAVFGVSAGSASDNYKTPSGLSAACSPLSSSTPTPTATPTPTPTPGSDFVFQGCYSDDAPARALSASTTADDAMTVEKCGAFCKSYSLFGLEYGKECYCGNSLDSRSTLTAATDCNMKCAGNNQQTCGAGHRLSLYKNSKYAAPVNPSISGYSYLGCYSEGSAGRALADTATSGNVMTVQLCATFCNGSPYFGVEYGAECYCGATLQQGSVRKDASECSMTCAGNSTQYCGAGNRLNIYQKGVVSSSSSSSSIRTSSTTLSSSTSRSSTSSSTTSTSQSSSSFTSSSSSSTRTTSTTPSSTIQTSTSTASPSGPTFAGYTYQGCYTDSLDQRTLSGKNTGSGTNSYASCAAFCSDSLYFGVEYGAECYCSDTISSTGLKKSDSECNMSCSGKPTEKCGAGNRLTIFKSNTFVAPSNPTIPGYSYTGCYTDSVGARVLQDNYLFDSALTIEKCAQFCGGSKFFGAQYGGECYCGSEFKNPSTKVGQSECGMACGGDKREYCGAGNRLSVYTKG